ncbi:MAG: hypothetical protein MUD12_17265 [Spirochaetes bacterium]|nr:hypothetical protein [Spirochaetota bacterium]
MTPLLGHLIIINESGKQGPDYKKHIKEIENIRNNIKKYNKKGNGKIRFDEKFLINLSMDHIDRGIDFFKEKYPEKNITGDYISLKDFRWFSIYNKSEFDDIIENF